MNPLAVLRYQFSGATLHILGGGPSIKALDLATLGQDPVIAVNNAGLDICPYADILFVMDRRWFNWNRDRLNLNRSEWRFCRQFQAPTRWEPPWPLIEIGHDKFGTLSEDSKRLAGSSGGAMAINLAYLIGARRIVLHGFDMRPGNYHGDHQSPTPDHLYQSAFLPSIEAMAPRLADKVEIVNATPGSALKCFPFMEPQNL